MSASGLVRITSLLLAVYGPLVWMASVTPELVATSSPATLVIRNGTVIDGTGAEPIRDGVIVIRGAHILAAGPAATVTVPGDAEVIDARGGTILPGMIDAHVHTAWSAELRRRFLKLGVTSICDLGSPIERMPAFDRDTWSGGAVARGFRAGPILTAPGGLPDAALHENLNYEVGTTADARRGVADLVRRGADMIKVYLQATADNRVYPMLDAPTLRGIVEEAHRHGIPVRAHLSQLALVSLALDAGVDVIEHVPKPDLRQERLIAELEHSADPLADLFHLVVVSEYDTLLPQIARRGIILVPTLARGLGRWYESPDATPAQRVLADAVVAIVARWHRAGGVTALGTDYNSRVEELAPTMFRRELELLQTAGLTNVQLIEAATRNAARACGHGDELGTLEARKLADVVVVDGELDADLESLQRVAVVVRGGVVAYRSK